MCPHPAAVQELIALVQGLGHSCTDDESAADGQIDLALVDLEEDGRGLEVAARIESVPLVYLVGDVTDDVLTLAQESDPVGYVAKPIDERQLRLTVRAALAADTRIADLRRRNAWLQFSFDNAADGLAMADEDGKFVMVNRTAAEMMRIDPAVAEDPDRWSETRSVLEPDERTPVPPSASPLRRALAGESVDGYETFVKAQGCDGVHLSVRARPFRESGGRVHGALLGFRDITSQRKEQTRLSRTFGDAHRPNELLHSVLDNMREGVAVYDDAGRLMMLNAAGRRMAGLGAQQDLGRLSEPIDVRHADDLRPCRPGELPVDRVLRGEAFDDYRLCIRSPAGRDRYVNASGRPLLNVDGTFRGGLATFSDVTSLHEAEAAARRAVEDLRRQHDFMQMVFESISDGVVVADAHGKLTMANASARRMVGMGLTEGAPETWSEAYGTFFPDEVTPFPSEELPLVRALQGVLSNEVELFIRNASLPQGVHVSVNGRPMRNPAGEVEGGVITLRDVTQRVLAREELARAFTHGRLEVVETVLHNIGNAINSVSVGIATVRRRFRRNDLVDRFSALAREIARHDDDWIPWLENDPRGRQVRAFILSLAEDFVSQNERMLSTVERVQDRARHIVDIIQTQESTAVSTVERKVVQLRQAIADAVKVLQESLRKRGIAMDVDCDHAPAEVWIQESRLHQMLVNLIKNAVEAIDTLADRAGLQAKPVVRILACARDDHLVLDVTDNGVGIDAGAQRLIFAAGYTTKKNGSGLGLHSAANFANACGGTIRALSSGIGCGTTIRVTLPMSAVIPAQHDQEQA